MTADLDVVVVNYNAGDHLLRCLDSISERSGEQALDVVLVDNASSDGSAARAVAGHPDVRLIQNPSNRGLSAAWNQGIRETAAPWVFLPNPDLEITEGDLAVLRAFGEAHPRAAIVGPLVRNPDGSIYESGRVLPSVVDGIGHAFLGSFKPDNRFTRRYKMTDWDRVSERRVDWVSGSCMLIRRAAFEDVGLFDERFFLYAEELDLTTRLRDAGWEVWFSPVMEVVHVGGVSTGRSRRTHLMHSQSIYRYYAKHRATGWRKLTLPFAWLALRARAELVSVRDARGVSR